MVKIVVSIWGQVRRGSMVIRQRLKGVGIIVFLKKRITLKVTELYFVHKIEKGYELIHPIILILLRRRGMLFS